MINDVKITQAAHESLAREHTEEYLSGINIGEAATRAFARRVLHREDLPLELVSAEASSAKAEIGFEVDRSVDELLAADGGMFGDGALRNTQIMAIEAGAKAGYEHRIIVVGEGEK